MATGLDPDEIEGMYWDLGMNQEEIASELGSTPLKVSRTMRAHDIPRRGAGLQDWQILEAIRKLAEELGRPPTVEDWHEHGDHTYEVVSNRFGTYSEGRALALEG